MATVNLDAAYREWKASEQGYEFFDMIDKLEPERIAELMFMVGFGRGFAAARDFRLSELRAANEEAEKAARAAAFSVAARSTGGTTD